MGIEKEMNQIIKVGYLFHFMIEVMKPRLDCN